MIFCDCRHYKTEKRQLSTGCQKSLFTSAVRYVTSITVKVRNDTMPVRVMVNSSVRNEPCQICMTLQLKILRSPIIIMVGTNEVQMKSHKNLNFIIRLNNSFHARWSTSFTSSYMATRKYFLWKVAAHRVIPERFNCAAVLFWKSIM